MSKHSKRSHDAIDSDLKHIQHLEPQGRQYSDLIPGSTCRVPTLLKDITEVRPIPAVSSHDRVYDSKPRTPPPIPPKKRAKLDAYMEIQSAFRSIQRPTTGPKPGCAMPICLNLEYSDLEQGSNKNYSSAFTTLPVYDRAAEPFLESGPGGFHSFPYDMNIEQSPFDTASVILDDFEMDIQWDELRKVQTVTDFTAANDFHIYSGMVFGEEKYIFPVESSSGPFDEHDKTHPDKIPKGIRINYSEWSALDQSDISAIRAAADFFYSSHIYDEAFALYYLLANWSQTNTTHSDWAVTSVILACARCANTPPHVSQALTLLDVRLSRRPAYAIDTLEAFLCRSARAELLFKCGSILNAQADRRIAMNSNIFQNLNLGLALGDRSFDLITFRALAKLQTIQCLFSMTELHEKLLVCDPGPFVYRDSRMQNPTLRQCLSWCIATLRDTEVVALTWRNLWTRSGKNNRRIEFIGLFGGLWQHWLHREDLDTVEDDPALSTLWSKNAQSLMGISPTALISTVCLLLIKACPKDFSPNPHYQQSHAHIERRALNSAQVLNQMTDYELAITFLDGFLDLERLYTPPTDAEDGMFHTLMVRYVRTFINDSLLIELPKYTERTHEEEVVDTFKRISCSEPNIGNGIASSLCSSDFSSFRNMAERIGEDLDEVMSKLSLDAVPTANLSMSWGTLGHIDGSVLQTRFMESKDSLGFTSLN